MRVVRTGERMVAVEETVVVAEGAMGVWTAGLKGA